MIGTPARYIGMQAQVAPGRSNRCHAGSLAGLHVARIVTHVNASVSPQAQRLGCVKQRGRVWLRVRCGVAGHHHRCTLPQGEAQQQRLSEMPRLVGDHTPRPARTFDSVQHRRDGVKDLAGTEQALLVEIEESLPQFGKLGVAGPDAKPGTHHSPGASTCQRPKRLIGQRRQAMPSPQIIDRTRQIRRAVHERAVKIKQDRIEAHHRAVRRQANK